MPFIVLAALIFFAAMAGLIACVGAVLYVIFNRNQFGRGGPQQYSGYSDDETRWDNPMHSSFYNSSSSYDSTASPSSSSSDSSYSSSGSDSSSGASSGASSGDSGGGGSSDSGSSGASSGASAGSSD